MKYLIYRHKSIITAIISIILLCGCANDEIEVPTKHEDKLYFNAKIDWRADQQLSTRAYSSDINFADRGFTVAGYYTNDVFSASNPNSLPFPNVFDYLNPGVDPAVINVAKDNNETNTNRQYWTRLPRLPLSNMFYISYFAWSSSVASSIKAATSTNADKGAPWIDAQVGAANTAQPDIVGAVSMNHNNEYTVSAIDLDFKHLLSKMSFNIKASSGMSARISRVECIYGASAVYSEARFTFDGSADVGSWGGHKSYLSASTVTINNWNTVHTTTALGYLGSMVFIPQSLTDDALKLKITYTITQGGTTSTEISRIVSLKALDMEAGKNYVYTLDVKANEIEVFNVTVESWIEVAGTDKGLPLVPGEMNPDVLLLLEGTDPPYTTSDGNRYWLDRSGWNRHCLILDKTHYSGEGSFDITYDGTKRGYVFNRTDLDFTQLYNHIRIPDLGYVTGNVGCEVVCSDQSPSSGWGYSTPIAISRKELAYNVDSSTDRALLAVTKWGNINLWDYASGTASGSTFERMSLTPNGHDWKKITFYGFSRINGQQRFCVIDNANSLSMTTTNNTTSYAMKHGMVGPGFIGIINYVKITKKAIPFEEMMEDYSVVSKKYYIKTTQGAYAPDVDGLIACWDARSGLLQGSTTGNGAYWMDQSGNNYFLKATVPSGVSGSFTSRTNNILAQSPKYPNKGIYMELLGGIEGKYSSITIETVSMSIDGSLNFFMSILDKNNKRIVWARPNTGGGNAAGVSVGIEINSSLVEDPPGGNPPGCQLYADASATCDRVRRSLVYTINFIEKTCKIYLNGRLYASKSFNNQGVPNPIFEIERIVLFNQESYTQAFTGEVNAFRIYNKELTQTEIDTNYRADRASFGF